MFERVGRSHSDTEVATRVRRLATEVNEDREQLLRATSEDDVRVDPLQLDELVRRARDQLARLEELHLRVGRTVMSA